MNYGELEDITLTGLDAWGELEYLKTTLLQEMEETVEVYHEDGIKKTVENLRDDIKRLLQYSLENLMRSGRKQ